MLNTKRRAKRTSTCQWDIQRKFGKSLIGAKKGKGRKGVRAKTTFGTPGAKKVIFYILKPPSLHSSSRKPRGGLGATFAHERLHTQQKPGKKKVHKTVNRNAR